MASNTATIRIYAGNTTTDASKLLPSPIEISTTEEIIWSANTGRSISPTDGALMMGDVVAQKKTFNIEWGVLTQEEYDRIVNLLKAGFYPFTIVLGNSSTTISSYRGTITASLLGAFGSEVYYKSASVSIIQR